MAQVVELFGAPGTGKSSLARALDGRRVAGRKLVAADRLGRVPRSRLLGRLRHRELTPAERRAVLSTRREDWAELLELASAAPAALAGDPLRALHAPGWLAATLELRALADDAPGDMIVILDEGLVQRAPVVCGPAADDEALDRYVRTFPPTALHVHLREDPATVVARLRGRDRTIDRHVGLDDAALLNSVTEDSVLLERCAVALERAGQRVVSAGGGHGVDRIAVEVIEALRGQG